MYTKRENHPLYSLLLQHPIVAAQALLGAKLVMGELKAKIVEVEAYAGSQDPGSHASRGQTPRNQVMFGPPGFAYVYLNYGMYWLLNVTALRANEPAALLIRAAIPLQGVELMQNRRKRNSEKDLLSGPGKLCQAFGIDVSRNGADLLDPTGELYIEPPTQNVERVIVTQRIGLSAGKGDDLEWRFVDAEHLDWSSRPADRTAV